MIIRYDSNISKLAVIDVGTNSFHLIVVTIDRKNHIIKVIEKGKKVVRLGSDGMRHLSKNVMDRGIRALKRFKEIAASHKAPIRAIATSAVREATNRDEFIGRVAKKTGIRLEVISGQEEARLIYLGVLSAMPVFEKKILLVDIGGGSTEVLVGKNREIIFAKSVKLGALRLTSRFLNKERLDATSIARCNRRIESSLARSCNGACKEKYDAVIGTSGTILNLARMINFDKPVKRKTDNRLSFSKEELFDLTDRILAARDAKKRAAIGGLDYGRVDIIPAGALILKGIFKKLGITGMTACTAAMREGIVIDTAEKWPLNRVSTQPVFRNCPGRKADGR